MGTPRIEAVGFVIESDGGQYLTLRRWYRETGNTAPFSVLYDALTFAEAIDVLNAELHLCRVGWSAGDGWAQPPMFD